MPIKTINMAGLQKWEETDDYIIYLDKDAVMTTVARYVTGSYDKFLEIKANVDGSKELLKLNGIEWTAEDDSKLFIDINDLMLEEIINTPTQLDEEERVVQTFSSKSVPTTYEACFRTDKSSGEIYIGEGYENIFKVNFSNKHNSIEDDIEKTLRVNESAAFRYAKISEFKAGEKLCFGMECNNVIGKVVYKIKTYANTLPALKNEEFAIGKKFCALSVDVERFLHFEIEAINGNVFSLDVKSLQITKTSTPKPFVKSVMPSGKLDIISNANETTHTFLNKGDGVVTFENGYFSLKGEKVEQFLVYNALLTEQEKQAELAKDIKLATNNTQMHTQI